VSATRTATPTACPTCGALTFRGVVNVRVWTGDNGAQRFYPAGDHAPVCVANVARQAAEDAHLAAMAAHRAAERQHLGMLHRWGARVQPLVAAHREDQAYLDRVAATVERLVARTPRWTAA
jgi:hypothetical protein